MIFFPSLYQDELLFSALARYHRLSGNINVKRTMNELFSDASVCAAPMFTSNLEKLWENLDKSIYYDPDILIAKHTILPYYAPFLPLERFETLKKTLRVGNGSSVYMKLGKAASSLKSPQFLRYCPDCYEEERGSLGVAYWHRTHQIEGVQVCHVHYCELMDSSIPIAQRKNKHAFYLLEKDAVNAEVLRNVSIQNLDVSIFISKQTNYLLNHDLMPIGLEQLHSFYKNELLKRDLVTALGDVRINELKTQFNAYYGRELLQSMNSYIDSEENHSWLHKLCRTPRVTCHPLRHMLLLHFLGKEIIDIYGNHNSTSHPFGSGPWICLNKVANHYKQPVISECLITRCSDTGKPVGTFSCECGFVYSRRGPDRSDADNYRIGRIKSFGKVWRDKLHELKLTNLPLRQKAKILGVDPKTVKNQIETCQLTIKASAGEAIKEKYRLDWRDLLSTYSDEKIVNLRFKRPDVYRWLYSNDREWLLQYNLDRKTKAGTFVSRVNWVERDLELASEVEKVCSEIMTNTTQTIRITTNEIGRRLYKLPLLSNRLQQLPKTQMILERFNESVGDFQIRRIKNNVRLIHKRVGIPKYWQVKRISGLRKEVWMKYEKQIEQEIRSVIEEEYL
ncbi:TnsD family Tn7-like transposition protein [Paenibacillus sp. cl130]|nr:TnsD family Tn7-like transposition protein [Paenibacillus sp. cl130]SFR27687.1 TniQ protein [Paenibacillus sp. cl130]